MVNKNAVYLAVFAASCILAGVLVWGEHNQETKSAMARPVEAGF